MSLPLFVLLRLHLREDFYNSLTDHDRLKRFTYGTFNSDNSVNVSSNSRQRQNAIINEAVKYNFY